MKTAENIVRRSVFQKKNDGDIRKVRRETMDFKT